MASEDSLATTDRRFYTKPRRGRQGPFLLIVRTSRIFTAHALTLREGSDIGLVPLDTRGFQHIARFVHKDCSS